MGAHLQQSEARRIASYREFWPFYLEEHGRPQTRRLHYLGTGGAILALILAVLLREPWLLLAVPLSGYGFAWIAISASSETGRRPSGIRSGRWSAISECSGFG